MKSDLSPFAFKCSSLGFLSSLTTPMRHRCEVFRLPIAELGFVALLALLSTGCATMENGMAAIVGKGGTIAQSDEVAQTADHARRLAPFFPATAWETVAPHEAADFIQFIDDRRVLVGQLEVGAYLGVPDFKQVTLYDSQNGAKLWEAERDELAGGEYSLIAVRPRIVLLGRNPSTLTLTALDPATGARAWHASYKSVLAQGVSPDLSRFFLVVGEELKQPVRVMAIDLKNGQQAWSLDLPYEQFTKDRRPKLLVEGNALYIAGQELTRIDTDNGRAEWNVQVSQLTAHDASVSAVSLGVLVWSADSITLVDVRGKPRWREAVTGGGIKLEAEFGSRVALVISPDTDNLAFGPPPSDRIELVDMYRGTKIWSRNVAGTVVSELVADKGLVVASLEDSVVGLDTRSGATRFRTKLPALFRNASPTNYNPPGQPDLLYLRDGKAYLSRESAGLIAFALPSGSELWHQPQLNAFYTTPIGIAQLKGTLAFYGTSTQTVVPEQGYFYKGQPSPTMQRLQQQYADLEWSRQESLSQGKRQRAAFISAEQESNLHMQSFTSELESAEQIFSLGMALNQAIAQALHNTAVQGLITKERMEIDHDAQLHRAAFHGRWYLRPFLDGTLNAYGVTIVNLESGRRDDLVYSPVVHAVHSYGIKVPQFAIDPGSERLITLGIGLQPKRYQSYVAWKVRIPRPSVLAYDLRRIPFVEKNESVEKLVARAETASAAPEDDFINAARTGNLVKVRRLLDAGVDVNTRTIHGYTALMVAADCGNAPLLRLLLQRGADASLTAAGGRTALYYVRDAASKQLLTSATAGKFVQGHTGGSK